MKISRFLCILYVLFTLLCVFVSGAKGNAPLMAKFVKKTISFLPHWISKRIRIMVPRNELKNHKNSAFPNLANLHEVYKRLIVHSYVIVGATVNKQNETKTLEGMPQE